MEFLWILIIVSLFFLKFFQKHVDFWRGYQIIGRKSPRLKKLQGRNQHYVKNRFIWVISKEIQLTREQTRKLMKEKEINSLIEKSLEGIFRKKLRILRKYLNWVTNLKMKEIKKKNENSIDFVIGYLQIDEKEDEGWLFLNEMIWRRSKKLKTRFFNFEENMIFFYA